MAEQIEKFIGVVLDELPETHPDRQFLMSKRQEARKYLGSQERSTQMGIYLKDRFLASDIRTAIERPGDFLNAALDSVAGSFGRSVEEIIGDSRKKTVMRPRSAYSYIGYSYGGVALLTVGGVINRTDHTTIINHCNYARELLKNDDVYREQLGGALVDLVRKGFLSTGDLPEDLRPRLTNLPE